MLPSVALLVVGLFLLATGLITSAKDTFALFYFKIIPVILGIWSLWEAGLLFLA